MKIVERSDNNNDNNSDSNNNSDNDNNNDNNNDYGSERCGMVWDMGGRYHLTV